MRPHLKDQLFNTRHTTHNMQSILNIENLNLERFGTGWIRNSKDMNFGTWNRFLEKWKGFTEHWADFLRWLGRWPVTALGGGYGLGARVAQGGLCCFGFMVKTCGPLWPILLWYVLLSKTEHRWVLARLMVARRSTLVRRPQRRPTEDPVVGERI
jgi:hypothetical protein